MENVYNAEKVQAAFLNLSGSKEHRNSTVPAVSGYLIRVLSAPEPILQIDWTKSGHSVGSIKYTYVKNADSFKTSYH